MKVLPVWILYWLQWPLHLITQIKWRWRAYMCRSSRYIFRSFLAKLQLFQGLGALTLPIREISSWRKQHFFHAILSRYTLLLLRPKYISSLVGCCVLDSAWRVYPGTKEVTFCIMHRRCAIMWRATTYEMAITMEGCLAKHLKSKWLLWFGIKHQGVIHFCNCIGEYNSVSTPSMSQINKRPTSSCSPFQ